MSSPFAAQLFAGLSSSDSFSSLVAGLYKFRPAILSLCSRDLETRAFDTDNRVSIAKEKEISDIASRAPVQSSLCQKNCGGVSLLSGRLTVPRSLINF